MTDPALQAALEGEAPWLFGAVEFAFPDYTLRLLDGSGELLIGGELFVGEDETFGVLDTISELTEAIGDEAPEIQIGLLPPDGEALATLASSAMQGSIVKVMLGAWDPASGNVIGEPEVIFLGEIDVPSFESEEGSRTVSYSIVSVFERMFEISEGERASDGWHQSIWPGERGFEYITGTAATLYWGAKRPVGQNIGVGGRGVAGIGGPFAHLAEFQGLGG